MTITATRSFGYWVIRILLLMGIGLLIFIAITLLSYQWLGRAKQSSKVTIVEIPQGVSSWRSVNAAERSNDDVTYRVPIVRETASGTPTYGNFPPSGYATSPTTVYPKLMNGNSAQTVSPSTTDFSKTEFEVTPPSVAPPPPGYQWQQRTFIVPGTSSISGAVGPPNSGFQNVTQWELVPDTQGAGGEIGRDQRARVLAEQLHATPTSQRDEKKMDELRKILDESFISKQEAQEQRLAKLSEEVAKTKEVLEKRKSNQKEIVDRRISELLDNPDTMKWDYEPNTTSKTPAPSTKQTPLTVVPNSFDKSVPYVTPNFPPVYTYSPTIPNRGGATKPNMPVYNPYEYQQPGYTLKLGPMPSVASAPPSTPPIVVWPNTQPLQPLIPPALSSTFPQSSPAQVASPLEEKALPSDLWMLGTRLLEIHLNLKHSEKENNPQILESLTLILKQLEANWAARSKEFQSSLDEVTKQIDDLNKLNNREWGADQVTLRETVQNQIQSLNDRKRDISRYLEWMRNFEQEQLAAVRVPSKAEPTKPSDESAEKPANATVPDKSK